MSDYASHLAAIGVGVAIAVFFVGVSKTNDSSAGEQAKTATATSDEAPASAKKKKNKKKKKASSTAATNSADVAPAPDLVEVKPEEAAPANQPATGGKKKKSKKDKKKTGRPAVPTTTNDNSNNAKSTPEPPKAAPAPAPTPVPTPVPAPVEAAQWQSRVEEEVWETIPKKGKKKKNPTSVKKPQQTSGPGAAAISLSVVIDASRVGIIIGPKGQTMNAIQEKTGTKLEVNAPKLDDAKTGGSNQFRPVGGGRSGKKLPTATVIITEGTAASRQLAKTTVLELSKNGYAALLQAEGFGESSVSVHPRFLSEIVGPGGKVIKAIQSNLDVKLTIPKTDWTPKSIQVGNIVPSVRVGIAGDSQQNVKTAKQVLRDLCDYHHHEVTHPGFIHKEIYVPQEYFHCVIGVRGSEIKHIRGNYRVDVYMPSDESWCNTESVVCVGKPNDVKKAISYITLLMDRFSESRDQKYSDEGFGDEDGW